MVLSQHVVFNKSFLWASRLRYFSLIMNLWKHVLEVYHAHVEKRPPAALPQIGPPGWRNVDCLQGFDDLSLAVLITNDQGHLVVIYRGSVIGEDWVTNFDYNLISPQETQSGVDCMKGRVHEGYFKLLQTQLHTLRRVVETLNPTRVTVTGHSLGGAMAHLASYYIATTFPQLNVEAVVVGAPQVADQEFFEDYRMKVNSRSIAFLGRGYESRFKSATGKRRFEVGDVVVQVSQSIDGISPPPKGTQRELISCIRCLPGTICVLLHSRLQITQHSPCLSYEPWIGAHLCHQPDQCCCMGK